MPWTTACGISQGFPWDFPGKKIWRGLPFPSPGDLLNPGMKSTSPVAPALAGGLFTTAPPGQPRIRRDLSAPSPAPTQPSSQLSILSPSFYPHPLRLGFCREVLSLKHRWNPQKPLKTPGSNHTGCLLLTALLCGPAPITPFLSWHQIPSNPESAQELTFTGP